MDVLKYYAKPELTIEEHSGDLIIRAKRLLDCGYIPNKVYGLLIESCKIHDLGKANPFFQKRIQYGGKFDKKNEFAHNLLSLFYVDKEDYEIQDYFIIAHAVLNHHSYVKNYETMQNRELIENMFLQLSDFNAGVIYKLKRADFKKIQTYIEDDSNRNLAILVKGLLHKCDYSASAGYEIEYINDFLEEGLKNLLLKWKEINENSSWNELQKFCIENRNHNIMVSAQTGMGKTEAGLHWIGNNKGFFILPIKAAINSIFERIYDQILDDDKSLISSRLSILHSESLIIQKSIMDDIGQGENSVKEYYGHSKNFSLPLNISTLDQLFNFVFKYDGYELKLSTLSYSKVVIDEIQMYSPDLLAYLIYGMKRIIELGGKFAILTATLSPFVKSLIMEKIDDDFKEEVFINDIKRHNLKVIDEKMTGEEVLNILNSIEGEAESFKVLIVCNTIRKAQSIYDFLSNNCELSNINLLHSKFIKKDRADKEMEIIKFGKTYNSNRNIDIGKGIWISTQLVEASLDIDFDYLITELSELNSLFQRFGRCNRKGVKSVANTNCFIFTEIDKNIIRKNQSSNGFIYEDIYNLSKIALKDKSGIISEKEKIDLIDTTFSFENMKSSQYHNDFIYYYNEIDLVAPGENSISKAIKKFRNISSVDVIPISVYCDNKIIIDDYYEFITDSQKSWIEKENYLSKLKEYTLPIETSRIFSKKACKSKVIDKTLKVNSHYEIYIINCEYDINKGFVQIFYENSEDESNFI